MTLEDLPLVARGGNLREVIQSGLVAYGGWCMLPSAFAAETVSASGCDYLAIDLQHGLISDDAMRAMLQAVAIRPTPVAVRVPWNGPADIMRALDAGADGVIVPMVNTPEEAKAAAGACRYPPLGYRSWGPLRPAMSRPGFNPAIGNEQTVCLVMIETVEGFANLEPILDVPGVDGALVGPNDLAISHSGSNAGAGTSERDSEMITEIAKQCALRGLAAATSCRGDEAGRLVALGYTLVALSSDAALLAKALTAELEEARSQQASGH